MGQQRSAGLSLGTKAIVGLAAGLAGGAAITAAAQPALLAVASAVEVFGTLWINAILMCILPLVVSKLIVSIAGHDDQRALGRSGCKAAALFLGLLTVTAALAAAVMPTVFAWLPLDPAASATLRAAATVPV
ncbi:MAG: cation:dicarboxylase symporter family transporter, partial [Acidobacteria bacterium]|nr:cation:dicarboxylase symporter family transporter [Acidobacteriota bacterium]